MRARAPLRLGLAGGGTDLSSYADTFGGAVLNATIDRYAFASIQPRTDGRLVFDACDLDREETHPAASTVPASRLLLHKGVYEHMVRDYNAGQPLAITVTTVVDAPLGSGLGSSSALMVALIEAYSTYLNVPLGRYEVAQLAHHIERIELGLAGGRQDQYAAAFGGINYIEFLEGGRVIVNPLRFHQAGHKRAGIFAGRLLFRPVANVRSDHPPAVRSARYRNRGAWRRCTSSNGRPRHEDVVLLGDMAGSNRSNVPDGQEAHGGGDFEKISTKSRRWRGATARCKVSAPAAAASMLVVATERRYRLIAARTRAACRLFRLELTERGSEARRFP